MFVALLSKYLCYAAYTVRLIFDYLTIPLQCVIYSYEFCECLDCEQAFVTQKLSQKLRHIRWLRKIKSQRPLVTDPHTKQKRLKQCIDIRSAQQGRPSVLNDGWSAFMLLSMWATCIK
jgi:hypothetical protein